MSLGMTALAPFLLGLALGLRHACDADHVVAVATIVARERNPLRSGFVGACWGLGHSATLLLVGGAVVALRWRLSPLLAPAAELLVALLLVWLGATGWRGVSSRPARPRVGSARPFWVGAAHGLAGSGGLALLALAATPSALLGLVYLGCFALGATVGMVALTSVMSWPMRAGGPVGHRVVRAVSALSVALGFGCAAALVRAWTTRGGPL